MKQIDTIMSQMTGAPVLKELANALREYSTEFPDEEKKYYEAVSMLRDALPADMTPTLDEFLAAEEADIISRILYAGFNGFRANVENLRWSTLQFIIHLKICGMPLPTTLLFLTQDSGRLILQGQ